MGNYNRNYLEHHGILGQKWGKRNGPPYPLDGADHSASEKKAGWRKSIAISSTYAKNRGEMTSRVKDSRRTRRLAKVDTVNQYNEQSLRNAGYHREADAVAERGRKNREKLVKSQQRDYDKAYARNYVKIYNAGADYVNSRVGAFNDKWSKQFKGYDNWSQSPKYQKYLRAADKFMSDSHDLMRERYLGVRPS